MKNLKEAIEAAPKALAERIAKAKAELRKGLPPATSGEVLSSKVGPCH